MGPGFSPVPRPLSPQPQQQRRGRAHQQEGHAQAVELAQPVGQLREPQRDQVGERAQHAAEAAHAHAGGQRRQVVHVVVEQDGGRHVADELRAHDRRQVGAPAFGDRPLRHQRGDEGQLGELAQVDEHQRDDREQRPVDVAQHAALEQQVGAEHHRQARGQPVPVERDHEAHEQQARQRQQPRLHRRAVGRRLERDRGARHQQPDGGEQPEQHHAHRGRHHPHEAREALAAAVPQVEVLRIADRRQRRARVDRQRLQHHQPRQRQVRLGGEHARERHQQEQADVVGDQRRQHGGAGHEQQREPAQVGGARQQALRGRLQHAALLHALRDREQARERAHGLPVDQLEPVERRARPQEGEQHGHRHQHPEQAVAAALVGRAGVRGGGGGGQGGRGGVFGHGAAVIGARAAGACAARTCRPRVSGMASANSASAAAAMAASTTKAVP